MTSREDAVPNIGAHDCEKSLDSALVQAIRKNDLETVKLEAVRLKLHVPPEKVRRRYVSTRTPLMEAVVAGMDAALPYLIADAGAVLEKTRQTALTLAVEGARREAFRFLAPFEAEAARLGPSVQAAFLGEPLPLLPPAGFFGDRTLDGVTTLMAAAVFGRTALLTTLKSQIGERDSQDRRALFFAAKYGHVEMCKFLAKYEAGSACGGYGSCLEAALASERARERCFEITKILAPFDALVQNPASSEYPLHVAVRMGRFESVRPLLEASRGQILRNARGETPLHYAAILGDLRSAQELVGAYGRAQTLENRRTALMEAAARGRADVVRALRRVEARMVGAEGESALILASRAGHLEIVRELLSQEEGVESQTGETALLAACEGGHEDCVRYVLQNSKMEVLHEFRGSGLTVVHRLCQAGSAAFLRPVLDRFLELAGAGFFARERETGCVSPLVVCAQNMACGCAQVLLDAGIGGCSDADDFGQTALHAAVLSVCESMVRLLVAQVPRLLCARDGLGRTALHLAVLEYARAQDKQIRARLVEVVQLLARYESRV